MIGEIEGCTPVRDRVDIGDGLGIRGEHLGDRTGRAFRTLQYARRLTDPFAGGSLSGLTGGPLFVVGSNGDNETTILQQPQP